MKKDLWSAVSPVSSMDKNADGTWLNAEISLFV